LADSNGDLIQFCLRRNCIKWTYREAHQHKINCMKATSDGELLFTADDAGI